MRLNTTTLSLAVFGLLLTAPSSFAQTGGNSYGLPEIYRSEKGRTAAKPVNIRHFNADSSPTLRTSFNLRWGFLTEAEFNELPVDAQRLVDEANSFADRVDFATAREKLAEASALAPNSIPLQFLFLTTSRRAAETTYGDESLMHYERASDALRRLTSNSNLAPEERLRVGRESVRVREGIDSYRERDAKRLEDGFDFVMFMHDQRRQQFEATFEKTEGPEIPTIESILNPPPPPTPDELAVTDNDIWAELQAPGLTLPNIRKLIPDNFGQGGFGPGQFGPGGPVEFGAAADPLAFDSFDPVTGQPINNTGAFAPQGGFPAPGAFPGPGNVAPGGFPGGNINQGGGARGGK